MWGHILHQADSKCIIAIVIWVKSHLDRFPHFIDVYNFQVAHFACNFAADAYAGLAGFAAKPSLGAVEDIISYLAIVQKVQCRLVALIE